MRRAVFLIIFVLFFSASAWAGYDIFLKNGSIIRGVERYEEIDGQIMFRYAGGTVAIPMDAVDRIEESREGGREIVPREPIKRPAKPAPAPPPMTLEEAPEITQLERRIAEINQRLETINKQMEEYNKLKEEYDKVRLRIEVLFQKGIAKAKSKGGDPAKWFEFLEGQERQWAQLNTLKKTKLEKELNQMEATIMPLVQEKEALQAEKQDSEKRLEQLKYPY